MREAVAESEHPVMLYSVGKDSSVMLHLAMKAFYPSLPRSRCSMWTPRGSSRRCTPSATTSCQPRARPDRPPESRVRAARHQPLRPRLRDAHRHVEDRGPQAGPRSQPFDLAFGGARRDEEKSRAKERVFSIRSAQHRWDPKRQRPELWRIYNARTNPGETRPGVPPLELDRARHLAVHPPRGDPDRAALLRGPASGGRARRDAHHGRRRPDAPGRRRGARAAQRALPHPRLLPADRCHREHGRQP